MMPVPTWRLAVLALVASLFGLVSPWSLWLTVVAINVAVLCVLLVDWVLAPRPGRVEVRRNLPGALTVGHAGEVSWTVTNQSSRDLTVAVADQLAPSLQATDRRFGGKVPAYGTLGATAALLPRRRGAFAITDVAVRVQGPLGLAARQETRQLPTLLRVHPPFRARQEAELRIRKARVLDVGLRATRGHGGGTDFDQLREYQRDDESRRIDWAATARAQRPIVRTYRAERNQVVIQLLDNSRVMAGRVDGVPRVEHAMDAVMMLTTVAAHLGDKAGLVAFDSQVRAVVPPAAGKGQLGPVTEAVFDLQPSLAAADYRGAFVHTLARFQRRTMLVLFTDLVEHAVVETLLPALPLIAGQHVLVVAAVQDPDVVRWANEKPQDSVDTYRQAAAIETLEDRARATAKLRSLGAVVIDAPPGELANRLADTYLGIKARGGL